MNDYVKWLNALRDSAPKKSAFFDCPSILDGRKQPLKIIIRNSGNVPALKFIVSDDCFIDQENFENGSRLSKSAIEEAIEPYYGARRAVNGELYVGADDEYDFAKAAHLLLCAMTAVLSLLPRKPSVTAETLEAWYEEL
jgi:hypothetical protein